MSGFLRSLTTATLLLMISGCGSLLSTPAPNDLYQLTSPPVTETTSKSKILWHLGIDYPDAIGGLHAKRIAIRENKNKVGFIQGMRWVEPLPEMLQTLVLETFEQSESFTFVQRQTIGLVTDYILQTEIRDYHVINAAQAGQQVHLRVQAKLVDRWKKSVFFENTFEYRISVSGRGKPQIITAFDQITHQFLESLLEWVAASSYNMHCVIGQPCLKNEPTE
ncbi:MAG: ABC-type transport auxiliary lipoprotein family protein [Gammaproteobacteria bacterium]|nr:ABC-type transport auxiliary lipoprotein family protein [Gammaproteobacteria bacterium]